MAIQLTVHFELPLIRGKDKVKYTSYLAYIVNSVDKHPVGWKTSSSYRMSWTGRHFCSCSASSVFEYRPADRPLIQTITTDAGFEVFTAMRTHIRVFWVVTPCTVVVGYQRLRGPYCLHFRYILKVEAARSYHTLVSYHIITRCHIPEDLDLNLH
jgi:hypothetical protein